MPEFAPFNYGNVLATAEGIKGARIGNALNQQTMQQQQTKFTQEQQDRNTKMLYQAAVEISQNPSAAKYHFPRLQQAGVMRGDFDWQNMSDDQIKAGAMNIVNSLGPALGIGQGPNRVGKYNPGDYTPESWAKFMAAGGKDSDASMLKRYEAPTVTVVGGAPSLVGRSGGVSGRVTPLSTSADEAAAAGEKAAEIETKKEEVKKKVAKPKVKAMLLDLERQTDVVNNNIDKALSAITPFSTGAGAWFKNMPNSEAGKLDRLLGTIKANVGFDKLQNMRNNSPTGGALGQVSEMENKLLQAVNGALDPTQKDLLVDNLKNIKRLYAEVLKERKAAYNEDYGKEFDIPEAQTGPSQEDLDFTAQKYGITVDEVKRRLGIQ